MTIGSRNLRLPIQLMGRIVTIYGIIVDMSREEDINGEVLR